MLNEKMFVKYLLAQFEDKNKAINPIYEECAHKKC